MEKEMKRKRSLLSSSSVSIEEEEEEEEEAGILAGTDHDNQDLKMEKFYELLRNFHDACGRRRKSTAPLLQNPICSSSSDKENKHKNGVEEKPQARDRRIEEKPAWVPAFKREDFKEIEYRNPPSYAPLAGVALHFPLPADGSGCSQEDDDELNLRLTL